MVVHHDCERLSHDQGQPHHDIPPGVGQELVGYDSEGNLHEHGEKRPRFDHPKGDTHQELKKMKRKKQSLPKISDDLISDLVVRN